MFTIFWWLVLGEGGGGHVVDFVICEKYTLRHTACIWVESPNVGQAKTVQRQTRSQNLPAVSTVLTALQTAVAFFSGWM